MVMENPEQMIQEICELKEVPYNIKVKCVACTECSFIPYSKPVISGSKLIIGDFRYPIKLLEKMTVRVWECFCKDDIEYREKTERIYKVSSRYFCEMMTEEAREELLKYQE